MVDYEVDSNSIKATKPMKQSLLLILLLGLGLSAPFTCAKKDTDKKSSSDDCSREKQDTPATPKQMALCGPAGFIRAASPARA
jgi:hypothetical protein